MYSQSGQDKVIVKLLGEEKRFFLEIGSNHAINNNNTYLLESKYGWEGLMIEYDKQYEDSYKEHRKSKYIISDATKVQYRDIMDSMNFPNNMGYLQIDLEVNNRSTLTTLEILDKTVFDKYKFAFVSFEHDIYTGDYFDTRNISRKIFESRGYIRIASDVLFDRRAPFEDWYIHPSLVNTDNIIETQFTPWEVLLWGIKKE